MTKRKKTTTRKASDEEVAAAQASPRSVMPISPDMDGVHGIPRIGGLGDDVLDSEDFVDEEPAVEEDEVNEGYVPEEGDEELEKELVRHILDRRMQRRRLRSLPELKKNVRKIARFFLSQVIVACSWNLTMGSLRNANCWPNS